jgi:hypothetical protein
VHEVVRDVELRIDRALPDAPVVEHPDDVARVGQRRRVLDDHDAVQAALDLLAAPQAGSEASPVVRPAR